MTTLPHAALSHPISTDPFARFITRYFREISVIAAYIALLELLLATHWSFFRSEFAAIWISASPILVMAAGMTLVILARHIDISIGSQFSVCGIIAGMLAVAHVPMPLIVLLTVTAGALMGAVNGGLVAGLGMPSIVVTLATMVIIRGALTWARQGAQVDLPVGFQWFGVAPLLGQLLIVFVTAIVFAGFACGLRWLGVGRAVYAVGSDREAARLAGIKPRRVVFAVFMLMGALTGLAAFLNAIRFKEILPDAGKDRELGVIAAVVVGGTAISGGRGTLIGTLIGVFLLGTIPSALIFFGIQPEWAKMIQGLIILLAVATDGLQRRAN